MCRVYVCGGTTSGVVWTVVLCMPGMFEDMLRVVFVLCTVNRVHGVYLLQCSPEEVTLLCWRNVGTNCP